MIFGNYPCCNGPLGIETPEQTPIYERENCPHCGATVWHRLSRFDPQSWTEAEFLAEHDVDFKTKRIADIHKGA